MPTGAILRTAFEVGLSRAESQEGQRCRAGDTGAVGAIVPAFGINAGFAYPHGSLRRGEGHLTVRDNMTIDCG